MMVLGQLTQEFSMDKTLGTKDGRSELWRQWGGRVPQEASQLVSMLFDLLDDREEEIQSLRRDRDTLVEAYAYGREWKAAL